MSCDRLAFVSNNSICKLKRCSSAHTLSPALCPVRADPCSTLPTARLELTSLSLLSATPVDTNLAPSDGLVANSFTDACGCTDEVMAVTKGFVDRGTTPDGCSMKSHARDSFAPSILLTASDVLSTGCSCVTTARLAKSVSCPLTAARLDLSRVAISSTNLASTSCCSVICCSIASRSKRFSSRMISNSSRIDGVSDTKLCVSSALEVPSSSKRAVIIPCRVHSSSFSCDSVVVRNNRARYRRPLGPRWRTISSASCGGIHPTSSMSCSDAVFKFTGGSKVAMMQHDRLTQKTRRQNLQAPDKITQVRPQKIHKSKSHKWYLHYTQLSN